MDGDANVFASLGDLQEAVDQQVSVVHATFASQAVRNILTVAAAAAMEIPAPVMAIQTAGHTVVGKGGALYGRAATEPAHYFKFRSGDGQWWEGKNKKISTHMIGAMADAIFAGGVVSGTDDTAAIRNWHATIRLLFPDGVSGFVAGMHYVADNLDLDFKGFLLPDGISRIHGATIECSNAAIDGFYFADGKACTFSCSAGAVFFEKITLRIWGKNDSVLLKIADDALNFAWNKPKFDLVVNNNSTVKTAEGVRLNYVADPTGSIVSNGGGSGNPQHQRGDWETGDGGFGIPLRCRQVVMAKLLISLGNGNKGLVLDSGSNNGNVFYPAIEEVAIGVEIANAQSIDNEFVGGKIVALHCINAYGGALNNRGTVQLSIYPGGSYLKAGGEWFWTQTRSDAWFAVPLPGTDVPWVNTTGRRVGIMAAGDIPVAMHRKANTVPFGLPVVGPGSVVNLVLAPMDSIVLTHGGGLGWQAWPTD